MKPIPFLHVRSANPLKMALFIILFLLSAPVGFAQAFTSGREESSGLRLATFDVDATPPMGNQMTYNPVIGFWDLGLRARGIILLGAGQPVVLCSVDWIGIANESQDEFKRVMADAAGTVPERVAVHTLHVHDAPVCDFGAEEYLMEAGYNPLGFGSSFTRHVMIRIGEAIRTSVKQAQPVTHIGLGEAPVSGVASNRRILGSDGRIRATRFTTCEDSALRAEPDGLIDPMVSLVSFWNGDRPISVLSFYAVHPQSYYRTGLPNPDFPGIARFYRQLAVPDALHVHFNGAGANIGAGKYNDGSHENRGILAARLADGMKRAWEATQREPVSPGSVAWNTEPVSLLPAVYIDSMAEDLKTKNNDTVFVDNNVSKIVWINRLRNGKKIDIGCLSVGRARMLFLPGELFVEFQLAAKAERPDLFVAMAAYGDYGPNYICTDIAYKQGGYEAGRPSGVAPGSEKIIMDAIKKLLRR